METAGGGWTVFQRRKDGTVPFSESWLSYKEGFGYLWGEFWLGNSKLALLTSGPETTTKYRFRADLQTYKGETAFAEYTNFRINSEEGNFSLFIGKNWLRLRFCFGGD